MNHFLGVAMGHSLTEQGEQETAKDFILDQASGQALIRSQHYRPYKQIQIQSFEYRLDEEE